MPSEKPDLPKLAFSIRDSEIASTVHTPGAAGAVIVAIESSSTANLQIVGGTVIGSSTQGLTTTTPKTSA